MISMNILELSDPVVQELYKALKIKTLGITEYFTQHAEYAHLRDSTIGGVYAGDEDLIAVSDNGKIIDQGMMHLVTLHELIHWTGAKQRLARGSIVKTSQHMEATQEEFCTEELTAEYGSVYLAGRLGLLTYQMELRLMDFEMMYVFGGADHHKARADAMTAVDYLMAQAAMERVA